MRSIRLTAAAASTLPRYVLILITAIYGLLGIFGRDPWKNDDAAPGLGLCKERAGIEGIVTHNAIEDAMDVVQLFRKFYKIWE